MQRPEWIENAAARPYIWTRFGLGEVFSQPDVGKENPTAFRKGHLFQRADVSGKINKLLANFKKDSGAMYSIKKWIETYSP